MRQIDPAPYAQGARRVHPSEGRRLFIDEGRDTPVPVAILGRRKVGPDYPWRVPEHLIEA